MTAIARHPHATVLAAPPGDADCSCGTALILWAELQRYAGMRHRLAQRVGGVARVTFISMCIHCMLRELHLKNFSGSYLYS
jgi:hypothetical protein